MLSKVALSGTLADHVSFLVYRQTHDMIRYKCNSNQIYVVVCCPCWHYIYI